MVFSSKVRFRNQFLNAAVQPLRLAGFGLAERVLACAPYAMQSGTARPPAKAWGNNTNLE
jgi:hypothetical protein